MKPRWKGGVVSLDIKGQGAHDSARQKRLDMLWREIELETTDADRAAIRQAMDELYDDMGLPR